MFIWAFSCQNNCEKAKSGFAISFIEKYIFSLLLAPVDLSFESTVNECASSVNNTYGITPW